MADPGDARQQAADLVARVEANHPLQYGFRVGHPSDGPIFDPGDDPTIGERYNRCPMCEQWSPCDVRLLLERLREAEAAMKRADKIASKAHDAMWAMDFEKTSAGRIERQWWTLLRKQASDEIHKLHSVLRKEKP